MPAQEVSREPIPRVLTSPGQDAWGTHIFFYWPIYLVTAGLALMAPVFMPGRGRSQGFTLICVSQWGWWAWAPGCLVSAPMHPPMAAAWILHFLPRLRRSSSLALTSLWASEYLQGRMFCFPHFQAITDCCLCEYNNLVTDGKKQ